MHRPSFPALALALALAFPAVQSAPLAAPPSTASADLGNAHASAAVRQLAEWAVESGDPGDRPFAIVDKVDGRVYVFDASGRLSGASAALVGSARGDDSVPGIGSRMIADVRPQERTTPAGRFVTAVGAGPKGEDVLWVDYEAGVALHRVVTNVPEERRLQRLQSKVAADRRITYGCINVPVAFFEEVVLPAFKPAPGVVYVLPETKRPQELFGSWGVREARSMHASVRTGAR